MCKQLVFTNQNSYVIAKFCLWSEGRETKIGIFVLWSYDV